MVYATDSSTIAIVIEYSQLVLGASILGLGDVGNANSTRCDTHLFDVFLQSLLHFVELAVDTFQSIACHLLALAQVLGIAIHRHLAHMDISDDWLGTLGTYTGGLEPYPACGGMDANCTQTIEYTQATLLQQKIEYKLLNNYTNDEFNF